MLIHFRLLLTCLVTVLLSLTTVHAGDRNSLPGGLANLHNQTGQRNAGQRNAGQRNAGQQRARSGNSQYGHGRHGSRFGYGGYYPSSSFRFYADVGPFGFGGRSYGYGVGYPGLGYGVSGVYLNASRNYAEYWLPPVYAPAELNYGPLANDRFLGIRRDPITRQPIAARPDRELNRNLKAQEIAAKLRVSNDAARKLGRRFIELGDVLFRRQRFHEAVQRYKSAIEAAPDVAEAYYREAYALIAVKQYSLAVKAFRLALQLDPGIAKQGFRLDELYGDNRLAMTSHLESLAQAATDRPTDEELLFLVGVFLHDDGQPDRAAKFFKRAAELSDDAGALTSPFLAPEMLGQPGKAVADTEREI